jgi:hypothetical protein
MFDFTTATEELASSSSSGQGYWRVPTPNHLQTHCRPVSASVQVQLTILSA